MMHDDDDDIHMPWEMHGDDDVHCIYPQANSDTAALPEIWRAVAQEIVSEWRVEGGRYQGCCCRYGEHRKLSPGEIDYLRAAGFLVEHA